MIIKRYLASDMNEAMNRIRQDLGRDAVIVSQRKIRKPGFKGFFSKKVIEITAAVDKIKKTEPIRENEPDVNSSIEAFKKILNSEGTENPTQFNKEAITKKSDLEESLMREMSEMKSLISNMVTTGSDTKKVKSTAAKLLLNNDVREDYVNDIVKKIQKNTEEISEMDKLREILVTQLKVKEPKMQGPVVVVGPTGVGKTTTIAKLAGRFALMDKKKVGLITVDTYRIGAVEQLKTYAEIMNIPFKVVMTLKEMENAVEAMQDCDVILVDTTGRSSKNVMQISELRAYIEKINSSNIHLVISCTTKAKDIENIVKGYSVLNYNNVIITKLDETSTYGSLLNIVKTAKKPISFITTGQSVPDDIKVFNSAELSRLVLGEDNIC